MALEPFVWGASGRRLTPDEIATERKIAASLGQQAMSTAPVGHWSQGLNRVLQGLVAGYDDYRAGEAAKQNAAESSALVQALLGGGATTSAPVTAAPAVTSATPATAMPAGADAIRTGLIQRGIPEPVADGFLMNFKDESGLNPSINEAKPLVPGSRGGFGLAQWTGPRRVALEQFAHQSGRPVDDVNTQLDFLVSELKGPEAAAAQSFMGAQTPQDAAIAIAKNFLRPAQENLDRRVAQYMGGSPSTPATATPSTSSINPAIVQAITSPYVSDQARKIGTLLFQNQLEQQAKANDPLRRFQLMEAQNKLTPLDAPYKDADGNLVQRDALGKVTVLSAADKAPSAVSEYKFYADQERGEGRTPLPYGQWDVMRRRSGATNVNTGTIPQGYEQYQDPITGALRMRPIPGGPKDTAKADAAKAESRATSTDIITGAAQKARDAINSSVLPATGTAGALLSGIGETGAAEVNRQVDAIKANAKVENLQAMRAASPTGGALGAVSDSENAMLAAKAGALDPKSPNFLRDLADYERSLLRTIHGKEAGDKIFEQTRPNKDGWSSVGGVRIRRKQ